VNTSEQIERQLAAARERSEKDDGLKLRLLEERLKETQVSLAYINRMLYMYAYDSIRGIDI
jgi:hypothetical protein